MIFHNTKLRGRPESRPHLPLGRAARIGGQVTGGTPSSSSGVWVQSHDLGFSNYLLEIRNNGTLLLLLLFSVCHYFSRVWVGEDPQTATFFLGCKQMAATSSVGNLSIWNGKTQGKPRLEDTSTGGGICEPSLVAKSPIRFGSRVVLPAPLSTIVHHNPS